MSAGHSWEPGCESKQEVSGEGWSPRLVSLETGTECVPPTSAHYRHSWSLTLYQALFPASLAHPTQQLRGQTKTAPTLHSDAKTLPGLHPWLTVAQDGQDMQLSCLVLESSHCCQTTLRKAASCSYPSPQRSLINMTTSSLYKS